MRNLFIALVFLSLGLFTACSSARVISDIDPNTDFTQYTTYTWSTEEAPYNKSFPQFDNSLNRERWKKAIDMAMQNQGYILTEGTADLEVDFHLEFEHNVVPYHNNMEEMEDSFSKQRPTSGLHYNQGTVVIHFVDLKDNRTVWQGVSTKVIDVGSLKDAEVKIQKAANKIFKEFATQINL